MQIEAIKIKYTNYKKFRRDKISRRSFVTTKLFAFKNFGNSHRRIII